MKKISLLLTLFVGFIGISSTASAQFSAGVSISANIAPPALPVYVQPACPSDGYLWTPGYWAYDNADGYYWVPGVWVRPPMVGYLWTPCYWGFAGGVYGYHPGYWGSHVGFYGGVNYGYGYGGSGFGGGRWEGGAFRYNTAVVNVNTTVIHNTYVDRTVVVNRTVNHVSYNGGPGGLAARPSAQEQSAFNEHHVMATTEQSNHMQTARSNRSQFASVNHGRPATTAMNKVGGHPFTSNGRGATPQTMHSHVAPVANNHSSQMAHPATINHNANAHAYTAHQNVPQQHNAQSHNTPQQHSNAQPHNMPQPQHQSAPHAAPPQGGHEEPHGGGGEPHGGEPHR
jgi:hypothetical protein